MIVFKLYFQIIRKYIGVISIYAFVFLAVTIAFATLSPASKMENFTEEKNRVVFINLDEESTLVKGLKDYLGSYSVFLNIKNDNEKLQDALFYKDAEYILKVPAGFTNAFLKGEPAALEKTTVPDSTRSVYTDMLIDSYLNAARLYLDNIPDISQDELVKEVAYDLSIETPTEMTRKDTGRDTGNAMKFFFNYLAYYLIGVLVFGGTTIMMVVNKTNIKRRNTCAPVKPSRFNAQILLGNVIYTLVSWAVMMLVCLVLYKGEMFTSNGLLYTVNSFVFAYTALSISFLLGTVIKNKNAQAAICNVLSMGLCFLSGVFVPQNLLSQQVLSVAAFTPTYWFVKANEIVGPLTNFTTENLSPFVNAVLIQLGFAAAMISLSLVIGKRKFVQR